MKTSMTTDEAVALGLPLPDAEPPADCGVCAALVKQRSEARARDDLSRVSDLNVEIRNHHPARRKRRRS
ncbi:hypothetical protein [Streptomyces brasiliscabiei]|uniref:hypothetical protein n=1 Tax=Streptomyces brasiliscabiei TaxID=2736302 RepID=UPI0038F711AF